MKIKKQVRMIVFLVFSLLGALILAGCGIQASEDAQETATTVNVATAARQDINGSSSYSGRLKASSEAEIYPKISERVIAINVKEGQSVSAGQTLITLDSSSLRADIKKAEAQVSSTRANQTSSRIKLDAARKNYERTQKLYDAGAASQNDLDTVRDEYESLQSGSVEASVAEAEAALLSVQDKVSNCSITAPISGVVGRIDVSVGDYVTPNAVVAVINDPRQMQVEIQVGESDISKIKLDSQVDVQVKAISQKALTGTVTSIASVLDANSDMYPVTVTIDNSDGKIKSGMYAQVVVDTSSVKKALCVPLSAILPTDGVNIVYVVDSKKQAQRVEVKTGISDESHVQILSGLKAGEQVVTLGNTLISDGSKLITKNKEGK